MPTIPIVSTARLPPLAAPPIKAHGSVLSRQLNILLDEDMKLIIMAEKSRNSQALDWRTEARIYRWTDEWAGG